jgi:hypothetical protein
VFKLVQVLKRESDFGPPESMITTSCGIVPPGSWLTFPFNEVPTLSCFKTPGEFLEELIIRAIEL